MTTLEELRGGGRLVTTGSFDLDPARAREKLARYQLTDPHRYVLQFVQAAQLLGATQITANIDADEVELSFDGASPTATELGEVYLHAFGQRGIARLEALRHLALGVIAAEAVGPAVVRVAGANGALTVRGGEETVDAQAMLSHNEVYVRERVRLGHLLEFFQTIRGQTAEEVALQDARYATPRLTVNGKSINEPRARPRGSVVIETPQESGWVAVERGDVPLTLVQHGVAFERLDMQIGSLSIAGVIESSRLSTNLSQSAFVRNHMWDALMQTVVMPAALEATDTFLSKQLRTGNRALVEAMTAQALRCRVDLVRRSEACDTVDEIVMRWADVEIWRRLRTRADARSRTSTQEVFAEVGEGPVFVSHVDQDLDVIRVRGRVVEHVLVVPRDRHALSPMLLVEATGREVVDLTDDVREVARQRAHADTQHDRTGLVYRQGTLHLNPNRWADVGESVGGGLRVEVGVPSVRIRHNASATVLVEGVVRQRTELACDVLAGCEILVASEAPTEEPAKELLRAAAPAVARAAVQMLDGWRAPAALLTDWLFAIASRQLTTQVFGALGWGSEEPGVRAEDVLHEADRIEALSRSAASPVFEDVATRQRHSIRSLAEDLPVPFVAASSRRRALQIVWELELVGSGQRVVWLDERERTILRWVFGDDALHDVEGELHAAAVRIHRGRTGYVETPILHGLFVQKRALDGPGLSGEVGMSEPGALSSFIELVVLHKGKRLTHRELACTDGQFRAIVDAQELQPNADMTDVVEDAAWGALTVRIASVCHELFEAWCVQRVACDEPPNEVDQLTLWRAIANAGPERNPHRLNWPVFETTEGLMSASRLAERANENGVVVATRTTASAHFAVIVPLASSEHLSALSRILPDARLTRARHVTVPSIEVGRRSADRHAEDPERVDVVARLRGAGFAVETLEILDDSALEPRLRDGLLTIGANHPLNQLDEPAPAIIVAAIGIVIARGTDELGGALGTLFSRPV